MNKQAIIHRPTDQHAYVCADNSVNIMIQTQKGDCKGIHFIHGDPYDWEEKKWKHKKIAMRKTGTDQLYDYWQVTIKPASHRLRYGFKLNDGENPLYFGEGGAFQLKNRMILPFTTE